MGAADVFATACIVARKVAGIVKNYEKMHPQHPTSTELGYRWARTADTPPIRKSAGEKDEL